MSPDVMTLPMTPQAFWIVTGLVGVLGLSALVYWALSGMGKEHRPPIWEELPKRGQGTAVFLCLLWLGLFGLTIVAAYLGVWEAIHPKDAGSQPNLGLGALLAALLGAPFLIWGTWLKYQTVRYQKEGHITDRINKAVEQLGAEKALERIGRPVTIWTGKPSRINYSEEHATKLEHLPRTKIDAKEWSTTWNHEADDVEERYRQTVSTWPEDRTVIQWQGEVLVLEQNEVIGAEGNWQVFSETVPNIEVRIGAILSLERIAQDSTIHDKGRDHVRVMEILCAYVRENAPMDSATDSPITDLIGLDDIQTKAEWHLESWGWIDRLRPPRADIAIALKVIGGRNDAQREVERRHQHWSDAPYSPDLSRCNLQRANLEGLNLEGVNFFRTRLEGAYGARAIFVRCNLVNATLTGISAPDADFSRAKLGMADLSFSILDRTKFFECEFSHTHFVYAQLTNVTIDFPPPKRPGIIPVNRVFFVECQMQGALLRGWIGSSVTLSFNAATQNPKHWKSCTGLAFRNATLSTMKTSDESPTTERIVNIFDQTFGDGSSSIDAARRPEHWPIWSLPDIGDAAFGLEWARWRANPSSYLPPPPPETKGAA